MTNWRYCVSRKVAPNIAKKININPVLAAEKRGFLKNSKLSIGWSECDSQYAKAPSNTAAATNAPTIRPLPQPSSGPSMMPYTSARRPVIESVAPTRSRRGWAGSLDFGNRIPPATSATATIGRFTRKIEPQ